MQQVITAFVCESLPPGSPHRKLDENTSLLESGIIDSTGVLELVQFLEGRFGVTVEDSELVPENLDSISRICSYLRRKGITSAEGAARPRAEDEYAAPRLPS
ncbi:MAG TPA: acyl carrier protein [Planctomycetota bacterium]|nr:acyl carrier protein [Planctomycetota bacterium]